MTSTQKLSSEICQVKSLSKQDRADMFNLMDLYYANSNHTKFEQDLDDKNWVVIIRETTTGRLIGFSTQQLFKHRFRNTTYWILFSGDTIVEHSYWGSGGMELILRVGEIMKNVIISNQPEPVFWMLITKGLRTFKFLPLFFNTYYPSLQNPTPTKISDLMIDLCKLKFGEKYNALNGIIEAEKNDQFLRVKYQPEVSTKKAQDRFFYERNPGYYKGDELVCLTPLTFENMHSFILKRILNNQVEPENVHS